MRDEISAGGDAEFAHELAPGHVRLFTNVQRARITRGGEPVGVNAHAIVLGESRLPARPRRDGLDVAEALAGRAVHFVRGYGPGGLGWGTFEVVLGCPWHEYVLSNWEPSLTPTAAPDTPALSVPGAILLWRDGTTVELVFNQSARPLDVADVPLTSVGRMMRSKMAGYWAGGHIPDVTYVPVAERRGQ